jgi:fructuronate reductase
VHEFVRVPEGLAYIEALWDESAPTLCVPTTLDLNDYRAQLLQRLCNSALQHRLRQIAMDGSQKIPQRLLAPLAVRRAARQPVAMLVLAIAAWMHWQRGVDDRNLPFVVADPLAAQTARSLVGCADAAGRVRALLGLGAVFGADLSADDDLRQMLSTQLGCIETLGALGALRASLTDR